MTQNWKYPLHLGGAQKLNSLLAILALVSLVGLSHVSAAALPHKLRREGRAVTSVLEPLRQVLQTSSAAIYRGSRPLCFGTVVSADGYLLTKASEFEGQNNLRIWIDDQQYAEFEHILTDDLWDLALIKVKGVENLRPVSLSLQAPGHGSIVISNDATTRHRRRAQWGIVSANTREVRQQRKGYLGVKLKPHKQKPGLKLIEVGKTSAAARAGLLKNDILLRINGEATSDLKTLKAIMKELKPRDHVRLTILRKGKEKEIKCQLGERKTRNDSMSGNYSSRRGDFPQILQHDTTLMDRTVGGPLLNLEGKCIGLNIADVNRCETYAIPAAELQTLLQQWGIR